MRTWIRDRNRVEMNSMGQFSPDASAVHDRSDYKYQIQRRSRGKSDGNGWKWMEMDGNGRQPGAGSPCRPIPMHFIWKWNVEGEIIWMDWIERQLIGFERRGGGISRSIWQHWMKWRPVGWFCSCQYFVVGVGICSGRHLSITHAGWYRIIGYKLFIAFRWESMRRLWRHRHRPSTSRRHFPLGRFNVFHWMTETALELLWNCSGIAL